MNKRKKKNCSVCKKILTRNDYYELCKRCQPAWIAGRYSGIGDVMGLIISTVNKEYSL